MSVCARRGRALLHFCVLVHTLLLWFRSRFRVRFPVVWKLMFIGDFSVAGFGEDFHDCDEGDAEEADA